MAVLTSEFIRDGVTAFSMLKLTLLSVGEGEQKAEVFKFKDVETFIIEDRCSSFKYSQQGSERFSVIFL